MSAPATIRPATASDAQSISDLVAAAANEFILAEFPETSRAHFLNQHSAAMIAQRLAGPFRFHVAHRSGKLAGVVAIRLPNHLYYLFVAKPYHRTGVARQLWSQARSQLTDQRIVTVNASNFAVAAYERLGFRRCGPQSEQRGVLFNPMEYRRDG